MSADSLKTIQAEDASRLRNFRRKLRFPTDALTDRDLEIFKKVEIEKMTHEDVATSFGIDRSRVTQIMKQVRMALAQATPDDPEIQNHLARQRYDRALEKLRYQFALDHAAQAISKETRTLATNRAGSRTKGGKKERWSEAITRDKPANVQLVKTFVRIAHDLGQLNDREMAANPIQAENLTNLQFFRVLSEVLSNWRAVVRSRPECPSDEFIAMAEQFEWNLRKWMNRYRYGASAREAWPEPPLSTSSIDHNESDDANNDCANQINAPANIDSSPPSDFNSDASAGAHSPCSDIPI